MGEATFFCKAEFKSEKLTKENLPIIKEYLKQHTEAEIEWQKNRNGGYKEYLKLRRKYKLAFLTYQKLTKVDNSMNELAGTLLDFRNGEIKLKGETIYIRAEVWHFDDWTHLTGFIKMLGGISGYVSDEYIDEEVEDCYEEIEFDKPHQNPILKDFYKLTKENRNKLLDRLLMVESL